MTAIYQIAQPRRDYIRVKTLGLIYRGDDILVEEVREPDGELIGYRLLGGSLEFGEKSWEALEREFMEELGEDIKITALHHVNENIFTYGGKPAHEVIFVYEANFLNKRTYDEDVITRMDSNTGTMKSAIWIDPQNVPGGLSLFPERMAEKLRG